MVHRCAQLSPLLCAVACGCARCVSGGLRVVALAAVLAVPLLPCRLLLGWLPFHWVAGWMVAALLAPALPGVALLVTASLVAASVRVTASWVSAALRVESYFAPAYCHSYWSRLLCWPLLPCWPLVGTGRGRWLCAGAGSLLVACCVIGCRLRSPRSGRLELIACAHFRPLVVACDVARWRCARYCVRQCSRLYALCSWFDASLRLPQRCVASWVARVARGLLSWLECSLLCSRLDPFVHMLCTQLFICWTVGWVVVLWFGLLIVRVVLRWPMLPC